MDERVARFRKRASWRKPLQFACYAALGCLLGAAVGEVWWAATAPPPPPPAPPPPPPPPVVDQAVALVLDTSGSMEFGPLDEMKQAALAYVARQDMAHTRIAVVNFGSEAILDTGLTRDTNVLNAAINGLVVDGITRMDSGISLGQTQLAGAPEKHNILLFTDGMPTSFMGDEDASNLTLQAAQTVRAGNTRLIAIATGDADTAYLGQLTADPALVFRAENGQFGEAFKKAERVIVPEPPKTKQLIESAPTAGGDAGLALMRIAVWTGILGLFVTAALIGAQKRYARQPLASGDAVAVLGGFFAGCAAGAAGQIFFDAASVVPGLELGGRIVAWTLLGSGLGAGMSLFIPNLRADRAALGGAAGGALGFVLAAAVAGDTAGRWLGAAMVGFCIGLMLVLAEMVFRKAWLHVSYGPADAFDMNLGEVPIGVGSDRIQCRIFARDTPGLAGRYGLRNGQLYFEDARGNRDIIEPGDERKFGHVTITAHGEVAPAMPVTSAAAPAGLPMPAPPPLLQSPTAQTALPVTQPPVHDATDAPPAPLFQPGTVPMVSPATAATANPTPPILVSSPSGNAPVVRNPWLLTHEGEPVQLPFGAEVTLGRGTDNRIVIGDDSISTRHAQLRVTRGELSITDIGSTNGTYVNGFRIPENRPFGLDIGDTVIIGHREFVVSRG